MSFAMDGATRPLILVIDYGDDPPKYTYSPPAQGTSTPTPVFKKASMEKPRDAFALIMARAIEMGFIGNVHFTIGTMCSGTDSPVLALRELQEAALEAGIMFDFNHVFSVEIEAFKQAFIERHAKPSGEIFRDVIDVSLRDRTHA